MQISWHAHRFLAFCCFAQNQLNSAQNELNSAQNQLNPAQNQLNPAQNRLNPAQNRLNRAQSFLLKFRLHGAHSISSRFLVLFESQLNSAQNQLNPAQHGFPNKWFQGRGLWRGGLESSMKKV